MITLLGHLDEWIDLKKKKKLNVIALMENIFYITYEEKKYLTDVTLFDISLYMFVFCWYIKYVLWPMFEKYMCIGLFIILI